MPYEYDGKIIILKNLAKATGRTLSYVSKVFSGVTEPSWLWAKAAAHYLGVNLAEFDSILEACREAATRAKTAPEMVYLSTGATGEERKEEREPEPKVATRLHGWET